MVGFSSLADLYTSDPYFSRILLDVTAGVATDFTIHDGFIFKGIQLCIPDCSLRLQIIQELHNEGDIGRDRTLKLVTQSYFWPTQLRDVSRFVERCRICQQAKGQASNAGLYLPLPIPTQPWTDISMDFVHKKGNVSIFVVVDHFSKMAHYVACKRTTDAVTVAQLFFREIYRLHGLPSSIISDRDTRFLIHFWRPVWKLLNTSLDMSTIYHPQTDEQTEVTNCSLGNLLRSLVGDNIKSWDPKLPQAEFAHNHATNRSLDFSPIQIVYGLVPHCPLDLSTLPDRTRMHGRAVDFVDELQSLHQQAQRNLKASSIRYKKQRISIAESLSSALVTSFGRTKDRMPLHEYNKLKSRKIGLVEVLERINANAYSLRLPDHIRTADVFNVKYLFPFMGDNPTLDSGTNLLLPGGT